MLFTSRSFECGGRQRKTEQILCHSAISRSTPILDRVLFLIRVIAMTKLETLDGLVKICVARPRRHLAKYARAAARRESSFAHRSRKSIAAVWPSAVLSTRT